VREQFGNSYPEYAQVGFNNSPTCHFYQLPQPRLRIRIQAAFKQKKTGSATGSIEACKS